MDLVLVILERFFGQLTTRKERREEEEASNIRMEKEEDKNIPEEKVMDTEDEDNSMEEEEMMWWWRVDEDSPMRITITKKEKPSEADTGCEAEPSADPDPPQPKVPARRGRPPWVSSTLIDTTATKSTHAGTKISPLLPGSGRCKQTLPSPYASSIRPATARTRSRAPHHSADRKPPQPLADKSLPAQLARRKQITTCEPLATATTGAQASNGRRVLHPGSDRHSQKPSAASSRTVVTHVHHRALPPAPRSRGAQVPHNSSIISKKPVEEDSHKDLEIKMEEPPKAEEDVEKSFQQVEEAVTIKEEEDQKAEGTNNEKEEEHQEVEEAVVEQDHQHVEKEVDEKELNGVTIIEVKEVEHLEEEEKEKEDPEVEEVVAEGDSKFTEHQEVIEQNAAVEEDEEKHLKEIPRRPLGLEVKVAWPSVETVLPRHRWWRPKCLSKSSERKTNIRDGQKPSRFLRFLRLCCCCCANAAE
ncbi:uncharacterized protein [Engystomops pustulosus]|uniref:uncharacterized protein n=1 Tax=Engystomops pustulosus TaxID=76066 RepID=UPI003AFA483A